jgi:glycosyltransferase involved in cell wall biosynthesis
MNPPLRILHVITAFDRGGAENHLAELVRHQRLVGMEVTVAYLRGGGSLAPVMRELGATVHDLALRFYGDPRPLRRLRRLLAREKFQLVHAHLPPAELYTRLALLGTSSAELPLVISKHNDCPFHRLPGELTVEREVAARAAAVIVISEAVQRYMVARGVGIRPGQMETIPYGIDVAPFQMAAPGAVASLRKAWGAERDTLVIGFVGRIVAQKSIDTLIGGFAEFLRVQPCDARLVIVGEGPLLEALQRCARDNGVADRVVWAGFREDIPLVMQAFDVFALTSIFEGFGLVLVEAMAARRPIVASRISAIPEIVVDGETGFLTEPRSAESVAAALTRLGECSTRARLGAAGYRRAFEHFTLERMWKSTDEVYARCLAALPGDQTASGRFGAVTTP